MCKRYQPPILAIISYIHILNAASVHVTPSSASLALAAAAALAVASPSSTSTSVKPSTLLLPSGFDSQLPPRQPMLYPFVVSSSPPSPPSPPLPRKPVAAYITPGWIPISSSNAKGNELPIFANPLTSSTTPVPPILEDRISKYVLESNDNGPVFESIVYGTWKPDPPLQPVEIVNATTAPYGSNSGGSVGAGKDNEAGIGYAIAGKFSNKTINRQHGGFIDNKQQKPIKFEKFEKDSHEKSSSVDRISNESFENMEQRPRLGNKYVKKQGRQKIRSNSTSPTTTATTGAASTTTKITTTTTVGTTATASQQQFPITLESTEQSATMRDVIQVSINVPVEVVRQINDSIEIKYNHKQTSRHSIEMTEHERYDEHQHQHQHQQHHQQHHHQHDHHHNHRYREQYPNDGDQKEQQTKKLSTVTTPTAAMELPEQQHQQEEEEEDEDEDELGNSSVIRMNWPTDFMETPLLSSTTTEEPFDDENAATKSLSMESGESSELPLALSALNIPPSLWPKLPGNITKLGSPYAAESSLEEPAICVPITVQEFNMMNSNEVVNIERVFCFPMPSGSNAVREPLLSTSTTKGGGNRAPVHDSIGPPAIKANIQNYEEYYDTHSANTSNVLKSKPIYLLCYFVVFYFKYIY